MRRSKPHDQERHLLLVRRTWLRAFRMGTVCLALSTQAGVALCDTISFPKVERVSASSVTRVTRAANSSSSYPVSTSPTTSSRLGQPLSANPEKTNRPGQKRAEELVAEASLSYSRRDFQGARKALRQARSIDPYCGSGLLLEARVAQHLGLVAESVAALDAAAAANPRSPEIQLTAGR